MWWQNKTWREEASADMTFGNFRCIWNDGYTMTVLSRRRTRDFKCIHGNQSLRYISPSGEGGRLRYLVLVFSAERRCRLSLADSDHLGCYYLGLGRGRVGVMWWSRPRGGWPPRSSPPPPPPQLLTSIFSSLYPSKRDTLNQFWSDVGPSSTTLAQQTDGLILYSIYRFITTHQTQEVNQCLFNVGPAS